MGKTRNDGLEPLGTLRFETLVKLAMEQKMPQVEIDASKNDMEQASIITKRALKRFEDRKVLVPIFPDKPVDEKSNPAFALDATIVHYFKRSDPRASTKMSRVKVLTALDEKRKELFALASQKKVKWDEIPSLMDKFEKELLATEKAQTAPVEPPKAQSAA